MPGTPDELYMEDRIEKYLTQKYILKTDGTLTNIPEYHSVEPGAFDKKFCVIPDEVIAFLQESQPDTYKELVENAGGEAAARKSVLDRLDSELRRGPLHLFQGNARFEAGYGARFNMVFYKPASGLTPEHELLYEKNRLAVVRQLRYSEKNDNEIDMVLFVNGIPIVTIELKNSLTGQRHINAIRQYMCDRPVEGEKFLEFKRCLVHFAVGTEQVFMTTKLAGEKTRFFPFNMTYANEKTVSISYKTSYLWMEVLSRDNLLDLLQNFINLQTVEEKYYNERTGKIETRTDVRLIFPRYHQRRAVLNLVDDVKKKGAGHRYLIKHSAGSGKSNTITWLAFRLSNLYQTAVDEKPIFDSVLVVTDRRVLDRQLQNNLRQFQITEGVVKYIDNKCNSQDLKKAIEDRKRIIVTTLQKFPVISDTIQLFPDRKYAVIIDEAHSSQSGEAARQMRKALSLEEAEAFDAEDAKGADPEVFLNNLIEEEINRKGYKHNISFFAFTATPKQKTIELFCEREDGQKRPFDEYTMEDAIKEGFILDVLENYMSFKRYYKLVRDPKFPDKEYEKKKAVKLLSSYVDLQDVAIERKSRIMLEQFVSQTSNQIQGKARAMVVTRSRLHAVRYKRKFDELMREMRLPYGALVAFSGSVYDEDTGETYTESSMNNLEGNVDIPEAFKMPKYRILVVAEKFQTGFDEPLLHTMFVDKKLAAESAVQTLSRLNRTCSGKNSTMVLDFVNDPEVIKQGFQDYYGSLYMNEEDETDPNSLYDLKSRIKEFEAFDQIDVDDFASYYYPDNVNKDLVYGVLYRAVDKVKARLNEEDLVKFRKTSKQYTNLYKFLSQIITFKDVELDKLYVFLIALAKLLPYQKDEMPKDILNETELDSYKVQYQFTKKLNLDSGDTNVSGMRPGQVTGPDEPEMDFLSNIIKQLNDTFGLDLTAEDKVDIQKMKENVMANEELLSFFNKDNTRDNIQEKFFEEVDNELMNFINTKLELYNKLTEDRASEMFKRLWFNEIYDKLVRGFR